MKNNYFKAFFIGSLVLVFCLDLIACTTHPTATQPAAVIQPAAAVMQPATEKSNPDYYVVALSWSPEYCKTHSQVIECKRPPQQAYRFVLHGLWPSLKKVCTKEQPSQAVINATLPYIPSKELIEHEWKKHGRCSGYNPKQFFDLSIQAYKKIKIPDFFNQIKVDTEKTVKEIKESFICKNPNLKYDSIRVVSVNKEFSELEVCLDKSLQAINCPYPPKSNPTEIVIVPPGA